MTTTWVAAPDDISAPDGRLTWHAVQGKPQPWNTSLCQRSIAQALVLQTSPILPKWPALNEQICGPCAFPDVRVPDGWTIEMMPRIPDQLVLNTPSPLRYTVTIDFGKRGFRGGYSSDGRLVGDEWNKKRKKYGGRNWRKELVDDAIAHLQEILK